MEQTLEILGRFRLLVDENNCCVDEAITIIDKTPVPSYMISEEWEGIWINRGEDVTVMDIITYQHYFLRSLRNRIHEIEDELYRCILIKSSSDISSSLLKLIVYVENLIRKNEQFPYSNEKMQLCINQNLNRLKDSFVEFDSLYGTPSAEFQGAKNKIKWHVGVAAIGQFFKELLEVRTEKGNLVFPNQSRADIVRLIMDNFVDGDGEPFKRKSLETYINENNRVSAPRRNIIEGDFSELQKEKV